MNKGLVIIAVFMAAASALLVAIVIAFGSRTPTTTPAAERNTFDSSSGTPQQVTAGSPAMTGSRKYGDAANDASTIRGYVKNLKLAATTDDAALKRAMLSALSRYGAEAAPIIREAFTGASDPKVHTALEEALSQTQ